MSDHTPGPLTIKKATEIPKSDWAIIDNGRIIGEAFYRVGRNVYRPAENNARLWSKAPELLESLKELVDCLESIMRRQAWGKPIEKAHALIAELEDE